MSAGLHRFFVPRGLLGGPRVALTGEQAHQISRVLRLKIGDRVVLLDGAGHEYRVRLDDVRSSAVTGDVDDVRASRPEPRLQVTLYQALVLRDRFETVMQKGTEVGVSRFVPVWCERSAVPRGDQIDAKRLERWRRIVTEAAEQCERGRVPEILPPVRFTEALEQAAGGPALLALERETERSLQAGLRAALDQRLTDNDGKSTASLGLLVGPEGGFSSTEVAAAREAGVITVSLGPRILRTETAGPVLAALALYEAGDMVPFVQHPAAGAAPDRT
jgi:16S rRNA (uracil1498-N3)-methyltransferase